MKRYYFLFVAALLALSACSDDGEAPVTLPSGGTISGSWDTGCFSNTPISENITDTYSGNTLSEILDGWLSNLTCTGAASANADLGGTITLGNTVQASGRSATKVDLLPTAYGLTPNDQTTADFYNSLAHFGYTDWAPGVRKNILGRDFSGNPEPVTQLKDLISIDENVTPAQLYYGDTPLDFEGYPTTLDFSEPYSRL